MGFPENLKKWRTIRGFSRRQMAEKLDMQEGSYGFYENGRAKPDTSKLLIIAEMLQVSTDELLGFRLDEFTWCKNFWEECGYKIEEPIYGGVEIMFNERVEQIAVINGKTVVFEYDSLPIISREEFIELTRAVDDRLNKQMRESRIGLLDIIIETAADDLGLVSVSETPDGVKTYRRVRPSADRRSTTANEKASD